MNVGRVTVTEGCKSIRRCYIADILPDLKSFMTSLYPKFLLFLVQCSQKLGKQDCRYLSYCSWNHENIQIVLCPYSPIILKPVLRLIHQTFSNLTVRQLRFCQKLGYFQIRKILNKRLRIFLDRLMNTDYCSIFVCKGTKYFQWSEKNCIK